MSKAVISGTYSDLKFIKTRSVCQVVIEVPIEQGAAIVDAFGAPQPGGEVHVALARIQKAQQPTTARQETEAPTSTRRRFDDLPRSQQAALRCGDAEFQAWIEHAYPAVWQKAASPTETAVANTASAVRVWCAVSSRSLFDRNEGAARRWDDLLFRYEQDTGRMPVDYRSGVAA